MSASTPTTPTVRDLVAAIDARTPFAWAEDWDRVGLLAGDGAAPLTRAYVTLDPSPGAVALATGAGANVLVTHHPAYLTAPAPVAAASGPQATVVAALAAGVALVAAHTNLDRDPAGADSLPRALGLVPREPLESGTQPVSRITVFCPPDAADRVAGAMTAAGAGRIGLYADCSFAAPGEGRFLGLAGARPAVGVPGAPECADEVRVETVCPPDRAGAVAAAARAVHPYEEPLIVVDAASISRGAARLGRVCGAPRHATVDSVARMTATALGIRPRVWGDGSARVSTIATCGGSAGSLVEAALACGAQVLVCGELRYHDATEAAAAGLAVVEAGHDATEWPLVPVLAEIVRTTPGLDPGAVVVEEPRVAWRVVDPEV
ncbi:MAG: Nif3-like dinuclear metal center hexameric protein [Actinobacteria bacterium]|nr:MAG: Nif3-like dinuclear metal center hexameric protein [Actinomycetota bacterium]